MLDNHGRKIDYLRISITDRCNMRCVYCMPEKGIDWQPHQLIMRYEEIIKFVRVAVDYGIKKVRITGGEPLVRPGIEEFVKMLRDIEKLEDISMTTNGYLLAEKAKQLKEAGLNRVNISLDTLNPVMFNKITRSGEISRVWEGILAAYDYGLTPIKINCVVIRGINDNQLIDMVNLTKNYSWHIRFIELMPIKNAGSWGEDFPNIKDAYISTQEMKSILKGCPLVPVDNSLRNGPASLYQVPGYLGYVGFISPIDDNHFCERCNRLRLTSDGFLRPCLMSDMEINVLNTIRENGDLNKVLQQAIRLKPRKHELILNNSPEIRTMRQIGG